MPGVTESGSGVTFLYSEEAYYQDCLDRRSMSCSSFSYDNGGFSATFTGDRERLVFFSVPYEGGWSATVNGEPAVIEKVNVGFMAVLVPAGTSEIRFTYRTPGLPLGAAVTLAGVLILLLYLRLARRFDRAAAETAPVSAPPAQAAAPGGAEQASSLTPAQPGFPGAPPHGPAPAAQEPPASPASADGDPAANDSTL